MFLVRQGTPISDIDPNELPSPRYDAKKKKIKVLPHYSEKVDDSKKNPRVQPRKPYDDKNLREILDLLYRHRKQVSLNHIIKMFHIETSYFCSEEGLRWSKDFKCRST